MPHGAWLSPVRISDPSAKGAAENQRQLTLAIEHYVGDAGFFSRANLLPGEPADDEVVLAFDFDRYQVERRIHPAYFPGALLTLTLYIWFGGPIYRDAIDYSASLSISDVSRKELLRYSGRVDDESNVSLFSPHYVLPSSAEVRTRLVRSLLEQAVYGLNHPDHPTPP